NASIQVTKSGRGLADFSVDVQSGNIQMPFGGAVSLPEVHFNSGGKANTDVTLSGLNLDGFAIDDARFSLNLAAGKLLAWLKDPVGLHVVESNTLTLQSMKVDSGRSFSARAKGGLSLFGKQLDEGTFTITLADGLATLSTEGDGLGFSVAGKGLFHLFHHHP